ncbi:SAM-dependent methyltransferase [Spirillospora sp. CA-108201]
MRPEPHMNHGEPVSHPASARIHNRLLGGKDHYLPDRQVVEELLKVMPAAEAIAVASRNFQLRAVDYLAQGGLRQFLDVGCGLPTGEPIHKVVRGVAPRARVVYVDSDPMVAASTRALPACRGGLGVVEGDMHDLDIVLAAASDTLDLQRPVAVLLGEVLSSTEAASDIIGGLVERLSAGSRLVISHPEAGHREMEAAAQVYRRMAGPVFLRTAEDLAVMLKGLDIVDPGIVSAANWEPTSSLPRYRSPLPVLGAVAAVPA